MNKSDVEKGRVFRQSDGWPLNAAKVKPLRSNNTFGFVAVSDLLGGVVFFFHNNQ